MRVSKTVVIGVMCCGGWLNAQTKPSADEQAANNMLAERLAQIAQTVVASRSIAPATLKESAALLEQAWALNPGEPRFGRLLKESYFQIMHSGGGETGRVGAIKALERYRALQPDDQNAQIDLIDLYAAQIDAAEKLGKYLQQLLDDANVPGPVKSHVAVMSAKLARERGDDDAVNKFIDQAVSFNPLSMESLKLQYAKLRNDAPPDQRVAILLSMIRANPMQPEVMSELGRLCADAGLVDPALNWYQYSYTTAQRLQTRPPLSVFTAYAAELVIADQAQVAQGNIDALVKADPSNYETAMLSVLIAQRQNSPDRISAACDIAKTAAGLRLAQYSDLIGNGGSTSQPTTQPTNPIDDATIDADVKKLQSSGTPDEKVAYVAGLVDLAWVDIYGRSKPDDAKHTMDALRQLLPADSATLARLDGWSFLVQQKNDEAMVKLTAAADRDPLAELGVVRINGMADQVPAHKLLTDHPSGLTGATLIEALRGRFGRMQPNDSAAAINAELQKFPRGWLDYIDGSKTGSFYSIKVRPSQVAYAYAEPMLATATITNTGTLDLSLGDNGALRPDLWVDVAVRGLETHQLSGVAFDRMTGRLVLHPREQLSQKIRVDQGTLKTFLEQNASVELPLYASVITNPLTQQNGIAPGPGGTREQFTGVMARTAAPLSDAELQTLNKQVVNGTGDVRFRTLDLLTAMYGQIMAAKDDKLTGKAQEVSDIVRKSSGDHSAAVRAEANYQTALITDGPSRLGLLQQMVSDPDPMQRTLGLLAAQKVLDPAAVKQLAGKIATDEKDEQIKQLAAAVDAVADLPPPTTAPASQPAADDSAAAPAQNQ